jgi:hypothetical protein
MRYKVICAAWLWLMTMAVFPVAHAQNVTVTQTITGSQNIPACGNIIATNQVQIGGISDVRYLSTQGINLQNGFSAAVGGNAAFSAKISSACVGAAVQTPIVVKVLMVKYNPVIENGKKASEYFPNWQDPDNLKAKYMSDVYDASNGYIQYTVVDNYTLLKFPTKPSGNYTAIQYQQDVANEIPNPASLSPWFKEKADYNQIIAENNIVNRINNREVDEVWLFGGPGFGFHEYTMAGFGAYDINSPPVLNIPTTRGFAIMGASYSHTHEKMLHNLCHRAERTMSRAYGKEWDRTAPNNYITNWDKFIAIEQGNPGNGGVGFCHRPVNGTFEYQYDNTGSVMSTANDWSNYPNMTWTKTPINRDKWGMVTNEGLLNDDDRWELGYLRWWFKHLPSATGKNPDGKFNNWWTHIFDFLPYKVFVPGTGTAPNSAQVAEEVPLINKREESDQLTILSNPFRDKLIFSYSFAGRQKNVLAELFTPAGILMSSRKIAVQSNPGKIEWDIGPVSRGTYLLVLTTESNKITRKVIKQ